MKATVIEHLTPELVISALRLLIEGYKVGRDRFKDKKTPDRVEEILTRAEKAPQADTKQIERSISEELDPRDAAIVQGDLELLSLLMLPAPSLDAFDYWGKLTQLVAGLQAFAIKNRLFELRGAKRNPWGEVLLLPRSGKLILPDSLAAELTVPANNWERLKDAECLAVLRKEAQDFPVVALIGARFNRYSSMGGDPGVDSYSCYFEIGYGQQRHWLSFSRPNVYEPHFLKHFEYRLEAADLISIVQALRDDIREYATAVNADEERIHSLFTAIDAFAERARS